MLRRINLSFAIVVLICFFLPWVQVSCAGARDSLTGLNLARNDHPLLWLIPLLMLAVTVLGLLRVRREKPTTQAIVSAISAGVTIVLMNRERARVQDEANLISAQLTGWFWLGLLAAVLILITAVALLLQRQRSP
jgi:predicted Co/Zn/Cd cation transporter (cation efflux family)